MRSKRRPTFSHLQELAFTKSLVLATNQNMYFKFTNECSVGNYYECRNSIKGEKSLVPWLMSSAVPL